MNNKLGAVYTKSWVVDLILDIAGYTVGEDLFCKSICETSCGQGAFLAKIIGRLLKDVGENPDYTQLKNCVRAYDIDTVNVKACRKLAEELLENAGIDGETARKLSESWILEGDYLLAEDESGYDFVVGNPPYLRAVDIKPERREKYCSQISSMTMGCDIYVGFYEKGLNSLKPNGVLCFICADRWMQNQYGKRLREFINSKFHLSSITRMHDTDVFEEGVSAYPAITRIDRNEGNLRYAVCNKDFSEADTGDFLKWLRGDGDFYAGSNYMASTIDQPTGDRIITLPNLSGAELNITDNRLVKIEDSGVKIGIGLATGRDTVFLTHDMDIVESSRMMPAFNMKDKRRGIDRETWIVNPWDEEGSLVELEKYPRLNRYMLSHKDELVSRHVAKKNPRAWYRTIDKFNRAIIGRPMLLFPDMAMRSEPVYSDGSKYPCHNCYWMISDTWDLNVLGGLLISDIAESFIDSNGVKMRGGTMRFQAQYLRLIKVPVPDSLSESIKQSLARSFVENDREMANRAAKEAYGVV